MQSLREWLNEHNIDEVEAIIPDMSGIARGKLIPAHKYNEEVGMRMPKSIFMQTVTGEYPDNYDDLMPPNDGDMILKPDLNSRRKVPWATDPTALLIHDAYSADGAPNEMAPRQLLKKIRDLFIAKNWQPIIAPELEFYLVKKNTDSDYPLEPPIGRSGRQESSRQSYSIDAVNEFDPVVEDIYDYCEAQNLEIDTLIHEMGAAQLEVNLLHGDPLDLADQSFLFKRTVRETALRHGIYATFMAKPMESEPGSAFHIHQSVINNETGQNLFSKENGEESDEFFWYLGGLQKYLPEAMCLLAPNVNSYRRLTPYMSAPINLLWGYDNRTTGLRIPHSDPQNRRIENRLAGADINPYLTIATTLACGYLGIEEKITPTKAIESSGYEEEFNLPRSLEETVSRLRDCSALKELLGETFVNAYTSVKESEHAAFLQVISSWEREHLLLNV